MIQPSPGPMDYTQMFGSANSPDAVGPTGLNAGLPKKLDVSREDMMHSLNPLQYVPVVGMVYRATTGEQIPSTMRVLGAGIVGGPLGMLGAAFMGLLEELIRMGPDTSRPPTPVGMAETGSQSGVEPVTPGTTSGTAYTTLATTVPDFLQNSPDIMVAQSGAAVYQNAMTEYQRSQALEKGLA